MKLCGNIISSHTSSHSFTVTDLERALQQGAGADAGEEHEAAAGV